MKLSTLKDAATLVGLTGGIGSGKSAIAERLASYGASIVDSDVIAHQITSAGGPAIEPIRERFGSEFIQADGALDRKKMRVLVFEDPHSRKALEAITHPSFGPKLSNKPAWLWKIRHPTLFLLCRCYWSPLTGSSLLTMWWWLIALKRCKSSG